jgi:hypothetical protein
MPVDAPSAITPAASVSESFTRVIVDSDGLTSAGVFESRPPAKRDKPGVPPCGNAITCPSGRSIRSFPELQGRFELAQDARAGRCSAAPRVLVAEDITSRFLNVIALFNRMIPLIAVQGRGVQSLVVLRCSPVRPSHATDADVIAIPRYWPTKNLSASIGNITKCIAMPIHKAVWSCSNCV